MIASSLAAAIALITWRYTADVDVPRYRAFIPAGLPPWIILVGIVPFAALNAAFEEYVWRGVLWEAIERVSGPRLALALTALSFGLAHYRGFPSGAVGVGLATIYGLMMGLVRLRAGGLLAPWIAHIVADVVIYTMVAAMVL
ncbi:MAG: CPBP family intramembrane glutamic endopeptidase [Nannocystaceae bacterium]